MINHSKHTLGFATILLAFTMLFPFAAEAQYNKQKTKPQSEKQVNSQYHNDVLDFLKKDAQKRQKQMNKEAYNMLVNLPYEEKLYDETTVHITSDVVEATDENGDRETNFVVSFNYDCQNIEATSDDYRAGAYNYNQSNSTRALCTLTKKMIDNVCKDYFKAGKQVDIRISSTTDAVSISHVNYAGEYGDFRYEPATFNDEQVRITVNQVEGINTNAQLAYLRARSVQNYMDNNISALKATQNKYTYVTKCFGEEGSRYRRCSIEITVHAAFAEIEDTMTARMIQDEFVDYNLPEAEANSNKETFVLIIANEDYSSPLPTVTYAANDGEMVKQYCQKVLGVPERHIKLLMNANIESIREEGVDWLRDITIAMKGEAKILVYYAGLGIADASWNPYIVPNGVDCKEIKSIGKIDKKTELPMNLSNKESRMFLGQCISLDTLCNWFRRVQSKGITFIIDAGFNSVQRNGQPFFSTKKSAKKGRGLRIRSNIVVFCAADFDKTAYSFDSQHHGFMTYFILKEWKRTKGEISYKELLDNVDKMLSYESSLQGKLQQPKLIAGGKVKEGWGAYSFR